MGGGGSGPALLPPRRGRVFRRPRAEGRLQHGGEGFDQGIHVARQRQAAHVLVGEGVAATAQGGAEERDQVGGAGAAGGEALAEPGEVAGPERVLQVGQRPEGEAEGVALSPEGEGHLAAPAVGHGVALPQAAVKVRAPADSRLMSKVTSPVCSPR